jgi:hypothetical protein
MLQPLSAGEPSRVVSCKPALGNSITPLHMSARFLEMATPTHILNNMTMVTDKEKSAGIRHVDLHADQACSHVSNAQ